jgi:ligand-binding sensor domain-containing protein
MKFITLTLYMISLLFALTFLTSFKNQNQADANSKTELNQRTHIGTTVSEISNTIRSIFQDSKGNYWFGTDGDGLYRFDGKNIILFTTKDGLCHNQIRTIQEDKSGNIWLATGGGVSRFDGQHFTTITGQINNILPSAWKVVDTDLWFDAPHGAYRYDGNSLIFLQFPKTNSDSVYTAQYPYNPDPYAIYSVLKDSKGNVWFGTESKGVVCFNGTTFSLFNKDGLDGAAVRAIFEDKNGIYWFSNNGLGLFRYDGKNIINFTEEKGLSNPAYVKAIKENIGGLSKQTSKAGTLSSVMAIAEDNSGNLWVGTYDSGVWRFDGKNITNYTTKDGLTGNAIMSIYKDSKGDLWFGVDKGGVCRFNGKSFEKFKQKL